MRKRKNWHRSQMEHRWLDLAQRCISTQEYQRLFLRIPAGQTLEISLLYMPPAAETTDRIAHFQPCRRWLAGAGLSARIPFPLFLLPLDLISMSGRILVILTTPRRNLIPFHLLLCRCLVKIHIRIIVVFPIQQNLSQEAVITIPGRVLCLPTLPPRHTPRVHLREIEVRATRHATLLVTRHIGRAIDVKREKNATTMTNQQGAILPSWSRIYPSTTLTRSTTPSFTATLEKPRTYSLPNKSKSPPRTFMEIPRST